MTTKITGDNIDVIANTGVKWNAVTVADGSTILNASAGNGYFLDTNTGVIEVILPTSPSRGDTIVLADYGNNFATNRVVVNTGGKLIDSVIGGEPGSSGFAIETNGAVVELIFADDTAGWIIKQNSAPSDLGAEDYREYTSATGGTVTESGNFKIHSFTGDGCFVVSSLGNATGGTAVVDYLVVAGGGAGANSNGGGGGAGGFRESKSPSAGTYTASPLATPTGITAAIQTYPITVGAGGSAGSSESTSVVSGSNSVFATITSAGGGGGGSGYGPGSHNDGANGGSAGGGGTNGGCGGTGNTPPVSPAQGTNGGNATPSSPHLGGGGGGATQAGFSHNAPSCAGFGGAGATTNITGSPVAYAGGGGGGASPGQGATAPGGSGGGGDGKRAATGIAGTANTGGGGGGGGYLTPAPVPYYAGGNGGKGIVVIRYKFQN